MPNVIRILHVREASQRRSLRGLDNTAVSGTVGFEAMHKIVKELEEGGQLQSGVKTFGELLRVPSDT